MPENGEHPSALELVRRLNSLFDDTDFKAIRSSLDERASAGDARSLLGPFQEYLEQSVDREIVIDYTRLDPAQLNIGGKALYEGWEGWLEHWQVWFEAWDEIEVDRREVEALDHERVMVWATGRVIGRGSGAAVPWSSVVALWIAREGKIVRIVGYPTREQALASVAD